MSVLEMNLLNVPTETVLTLLFVACVIFAALWKIVIYPVIRYIFVVFLGFKAAKGIIEELRKRKNNE